VLSAAAEAVDAESAYHRALEDYAARAFLAAYPAAEENDAELFVEHVMMESAVHCSEVHKFFDRVREALEDFEVFRERGD